MKNILILIGLGLLSTAATAASSSDGNHGAAPGSGFKTTSPQKNEEQIHSLWCWNASVRNLIYTESGGSIDARQCEIGNYVFGVDYACDFNGVFAWDDQANQGNWNEKPAGRAIKDTRDVLRHYGFHRLKHQRGALPFDHIRQSIDRNHGVLTFWRYRKGGGHFVVAYGYHVRTDGSRWVKLSDPWLGEGVYWRSYPAYVESPRYTTSSTVRVID